METNHSFPTFFDFTNSLLETDNRLPSDSTAASLDTQHAGIFAYSTTSLDDDVKQSLLSLEESEYEPTCVLLFKKVPFEAQESDILKICHPFGVISDIYLMKAKNYALIQFKELNSAMTCFETYRNFEPKIKGQSVFVFYTGKKTIYKTESNGTLPSRYLLFSLNTEDEVITNVLVASMLSPYGKILQIQLVQSTPVLAYVEMEDIGAAINAKDDTNDKIYAESIHIQSTYITQKLFEHYIQLCSEYKPSPTSVKSFNNLQKTSPQFHFQPKSETTFEKYESPIDILQNEKEKAKSMSTIMVKNLPKGVSLMNLFRLFGCYGNVMKIKIFFSNPENCLIEYQDNTQALLAKTHLNNCPFRGNTLYVVQSKNPIIINTPYIPETNKFLADFSESKEHRYRIAGSKNFRNIARPSAVLHLSNICEDKDDSYYHLLFKDCGKIRRTYPLKGEGKGLLVEMDDIAQAVEVLINYHNYNIEGKFLKVSFSKYQKIKD